MPIIPPLPASRVVCGSGVVGRVQFSSVGCSSRDLRPLCHPGLERRVILCDACASAAAPITSPALSEALIDLDGPLGPKTVHATPPRLSAPPSGSFAWPADKGHLCIYSVRAPSEGSGFFNYTPGRFLFLTGFAFAPRILAGGACGHSVYPATTCRSQS